MTSDSGQVSSACPPARAHCSAAPQVRPRVCPGRLPEQLLGRAIDAQDPTLRVDLDDRVRRAVDDRAELEPFELEGGPKLGIAEGDRQFVPGELEDTHALAVELAANGRNDADHPGGPALYEDHGERPGPAGGPGVRIGPAGETVRCRRRSWPAQPRQLERLAARLTEPQPDALRAAQPDELGTDRVGQSGRIVARGQDLAQLVLGEHRVGLSARLVVDPGKLRLQGRDPRRALVGIHQRAPRVASVAATSASSHRSRGTSARRSRTHDTAPGSRWPTDRGPSRSPNPRRATRPRVPSIPCQAARTAAARHASAGSPRTKGVVEGIRCRPERVVDRLVADAAAATRRESRRGRLEHPVQGPGVQLLRAAGCQLRPGSGPCRRAGRMRRRPMPPGRSRRSE